MRCDICGKPGARTRRVTRHYGEGRDLLVIRNVPAIKCSHCGQVYFTADTLHEIERIKRHRGSLAAKEPVATAEFAA